jgi:NADP+-dependent farnesol dehydrogenase
LQELEGSLQSAPGKLYPLKCDITNEQDIKEAFQWVKDNLGGVDILVNNAAGDRSNTLCGNSDITCVYCHIAVPPVLSKTGTIFSSAKVAEW